MKLRTTLVGLITLFVFMSLACAQAGEILTEEEATTQAQEALESDLGGGNVEGARFRSGGTANLTGRSFLINIYNEPGGRISDAVPRDTEVSIVDVRTFEAGIWYNVEASSGGGWVPAENLEVLEGAEEDGDGSNGVPADGPQVGDSVFLIGQGFLVNVLAQPNGNIAGAPPRGSEATVIDARMVEGTAWYQVDVVSGETGWVPAENVSTEAP